jgi:hypothetical protein
VLLTWLADHAVAIAIIVGVVIIANLYERIVGLENLLRASVGERTNTRTGDLRNSEQFQRIEDRLRAHTPALRRVLTFSVGISRAHFQQKTGITDEELHGLEQRLAPDVFWPADSMVMEEWGTHTIVRDLSGHLATFYWGEYNSFSGPLVIWRHNLPKRQGELFTPSLELVLHENYIKVWAVDGRFETMIPAEREAKLENIFSVVPTKEKELSQFRVSREHSDDCERTWVSSREWVRQYRFRDQHDHSRWFLTINDLVAATDGD